MVPGWAYSFIAALEPGPTSWTQILDARRLGPDDDAAEVTAVQVRACVKRLVAAGQHRSGDAPIAIVVDAGYDVPRLAFQLRDLPVVVIGRLRSDRVLYRAAPAYSGIARPQRHGSAFRLTDPSTWEAPEAQTLTGTDRYGKFDARAWEGLHPWLKQRSAWIGHDDTLPIIRTPATHRHTRAGLALDLRPRRQRRTARQPVVGVAAPLRHRAHLPVPQTDPGLDRAPGPRS
jgi:hypothetical protein